MVGYSNKSILVTRKQKQVEALFSLRKNLDFATVALSFVCGKYYPIID